MTINFFEEGSRSELNYAYGKIIDKNKEKGNFFIFLRNSFLPKCGRCGDFAARFETDCIFGADGAADSTAVAPFGVYHGLFIRCAVSYGAELADAHALPAAVATVGIDSGDVFRPVHNGESLRHRAAHGKAIRAVAVAHARDKGRIKGPDAVTKAFPLMVSEGGNGLVFGERLECVRIGAAKKAAVEAADDLAVFSEVRLEAYAVAVAFLAAECDVTADAGDANNRVYKTEDLLDVLDWHDLSEMDLFHSSADESSDNGLYDVRRLLEFFQTLQAVFE